MAIKLGEEEVDDLGAVGATIEGGCRFVVFD